MIMYRLALTRFCDMTGMGAKLYGGRWNMRGVVAIYAGSSVSSALLERLTIDPELFAAERYVNYSIMEIRCPVQLVIKPELKELPDGWDAVPPGRPSQSFGTELFQQGVTCFQVPSVVDRSSFNFVLNPLAEGFKRVTSETYPLKLDQRIVRY